MLRHAAVLARSATGQDMSVYTTMSSGPGVPAIFDGPEHFHVVLVDNGRSRMLAGSEREMLRCIRCSACLNHCRFMLLSVAMPMAGSIPAPWAR